MQECNKETISVACRYAIRRLAFLSGHIQTLDLKSTEDAQFRVDGWVLNVVQERTQLERTFDENPVSSRSTVSEWAQYLHTEAAMVDLIKAKALECGLTINDPTVQFKGAFRDYRSERPAKRSDIFKPLFSKKETLQITPEGPALT